MRLRPVLEVAPWENGYRTFRRWAAGGKFEQMHDRVRELWCSREERAPEPTAAVNVVPANEQNRDGADHVVREAVDKYPSLEKLDYLGLSPRK